MSTKLIAEEAARRGWKVEPLDGRFISTLAITPPSGRTYYFESCQPPLTSAAAMKIADNKLATYLIAQKLGIPVAEFEMYQPTTAAAFLQKMAAAGHELVVKPTDTNHGDGITVGVRTQAELDDAVQYAKQFSPAVLLQRRAAGADCRVIVVDGKTVAAARREAAYVVGDGTHTIAELIETTNQHPLRGAGHTAQLTHIDVAAAKRFTGARFTTVPPKGEYVTVLGTANLSKGGESYDITDTIHPSYKQAAEHIAVALDMFICGVDFLMADETAPFTAGTGILLEINATPGLRMHHMPAHGEPRDVAKAVLDAFARKIAS